MRSEGRGPSEFFCASGPYQDEISLVIRHMRQQQGARFICAPGRIRISLRWVAPGAVSGVDAHRGVPPKTRPPAPIAPSRLVNGGLLNGGLPEVSVPAANGHFIRFWAYYLYGYNRKTSPWSRRRRRRHRVDARRKGQSAEVDSADRKSRPGPRPVRRLPAGTRRGARFDPRNLRRAAPRNRYQMRGEQVELLASRRPGAEEIDAYEQVLGDAMAGDRTLFAREDYVEEAWRIVDPVLQADTPVHGYPPGMWGPREVDVQVAPSDGWQNPVVTHSPARWQNPVVAPR